MAHQVFIGIMRVCELEIFTGAPRRHNWSQNGHELNPGNLLFLYWRGYPGFTAEEVLLQEFNCCSSH